MVELQDFLYICLIIKQRNMIIGANTPIISSLSYLSSQGNVVYIEESGLYRRELLIGLPGVLYTFLDKVALGCLLNTYLNSRSNL